MSEQASTPEQLVNPITGGPVDEVIKEKEAKERGYFELEFVLRHMEDENEFVKYFEINGKKVIVQLERPYAQYKKKVSINHERIMQEKSCAIDDPECLSCGS